MLPQRYQCLKKELDHIQRCLQQFAAVIVPLKGAEEPLRLQWETQYKINVSVTMTFNQGQIAPL